jgi:hypothetical protein
MIGFLIKKTFFDLWDHLFSMVLVNLGFLASAALPILVPPLLEFNAVLSLGVLLIGLIWLFIYLATAARCIKKISDYGSFGFADFFESIKPSIPAGLAMGLIVFFIVLMVTIVIPFYLSLDSMIGVFLTAIIFWIAVAAVLSLQFFPAASVRLDNNTFKALKKCFIFFFDNTGFCIFSLIHNLILLALSAILAFLMPGPAGILLYLDESVRLRLLKYDWLEENPTANRKRIPWDALLIDEREKTGTRTLRNFIFPWKD